MKVLSVVGARPQFVKAFPVSAALRRRHTERLVHTGQHYDQELSGVFFEELPIPEPDHNLGVGSGTHVEQTTAMMTGLASIVDEVDPDAVLVYGDTNSTLAGALVAAKREPALVHVEAGLRSGDRSMPEEVNRVLTDHVSDLLCVPSVRARTQLQREGIEDGVVETGDVMYDAIQYARTVATDHSPVIEELGLEPSGYVLATVHRAANTDDRQRLRQIVSGLCDCPDRVVFPAHPRTVDALRRHGLYSEARDHLELIEPVGYLDFVRLLDGAARAVTDSGGVQKEAFYLDTPCVTLRETTEWMETVDCGWNVLVGADRAAIRETLTTPPNCGAKPDLYGNGAAAERVVAALDDL